MSAEQPSSSTSPQTPPPEEPKKSRGASLGALIGIGIGVILLSFVASFLGASLARTTAEPTPTPTPLSSAEFVAAIEQILPAGSAVRAGTGTPEEGKGYEGDVYIDIATSDVYVFRDGSWVLAGNIRQNAAENLTGETGAPGASGAPGEPGEAGTQLLLGVGAPVDEKCSADGDVYVDTESLQFYECMAGTWTLFGPPADDEPSPSPSPSE